MKVALAGKLRAGKSLVARRLVDHHGFTEFAFGDELKRYAHELFDVPLTPKPRELYQWFGQTMRQRDPDVWVRKCFAHIRNYGDTLATLDTLTGTNEPYRVVITDVRQPNELDRCRTEEYTIIRVNCPDALRIQRATDSADTFNYTDLAHESEQYVDLFAVDYDIYNVGTLDELYAQVDAIMAKLGGGVECTQL